MNVEKPRESISLFGVVVSDTRRFAQIANVLRKFGFGNIVQILKSSLSGQSVTSDAILGSLGHDADQLGKNLRAAIEELGTTYIKFGQMLSTRYDLLPRTIIDELSKLQDGSPRLPFETIERLLNAAYGDYHAHFSSLEAEPIGAASIAQVHRAVLCDGTPVVIKVQRPGLLPLIRSDIDILTILAKALDASIEEMAYFNFPGLVAEFEASIVSELDFGNERHNIEYFIQKYSDRTEFVFPTPFPELCRKNILVMRELCGQKITTVEADTEQAHQMADSILCIAFDMVFREGIFHGDPHPGNVFAMPDGRIGLLDFGLVGTFTPRQRMGFMHLVIAIQYGDYALAARTLLSLGHATRRVVLDDLEAEIARILQKYMKRSLKDVDVASFAADFIAAGEKFGVQIPSDFTNAVRALINVEGIIEYLNPRLDLIQTLTQFAQTLIGNSFRQKDLTNQIVQDILNISEYARSLPTHATQIMQDLEHDGIAVRIDEKSVSILADAVNRLATRLSISLMLPAISICLFFAKWMIPFYTAVVASCVWIVAVVVMHHASKMNRKKLRISPILSRMQRRMKWF